MDWLQQWDADDDEVEPEEPLSDEEVEATESPEKRARRSALPHWPCDPCQTTTRLSCPADVWGAGVRQSQVGVQCRGEKVLAEMHVDVTLH